MNQDEEKRIRRLKYEKMARAIAAVFVSQDEGRSIKRAEKLVRERPMSDWWYELAELVETTAKRKRFLEKRAWTAKKSASVS